MKIAAAVAIVGTRNPTRYGIEMTEQISTGLVQAGITLGQRFSKGHRYGLSSNCY